MKLYLVSLSIVAAVLQSVPASGETEDRLFTDWLARVQAQPGLKLLKSRRSDVGWLAVLRTNDNRVAVCVRLPHRKVGGQYTVSIRDEGGRGIIDPSKQTEDIVFEWKKEVKPGEVTGGRDMLGTIYHVNSFAQGKIHVEGVCIAGNGSNEAERRSC